MSPTTNPTPLSGAASLVGAALTAGERLPSLTKGPIDRAQLVRYAGASGDFNRIHYEESFARAGGYPTVIAQGMLSMAFLGQVVSDWAGPAAIKRIKSRFRAVTFEGDTVTCHGEIAALRVEDGVEVVEVKLWAETRPGYVTVEGSAIVIRR